MFNRPYHKRRTPWMERRRAGRRVEKFVASGHLLPHVGEGTDEGADRRFMAARPGDLLWGSPYAGCFFANRLSGIAQHHVGDDHAGIAEPIGQAFEQFVKILQVDQLCGAGGALVKPLELLEHHLVEFAFDVL